MKVDFEALRRAIEAGCAEAAHDAGLEMVAVRVDIIALSTTTATGRPIVVPGIHVEVEELTPEEAGALIRGAGKAN